jgi:hypothetical protein
MAANVGGDDRFEYPDRAGYPDGEGTLDEGTGAFGSRGFSPQAADGDEGDDIVDELVEFDAPDARDE